MKQLRDILGYFLGFVLFVGLMPTLMWLVSGRPAFWSEVATKDVVAWGLMLCGLLLGTPRPSESRGGYQAEHKHEDKHHHYLRREFSYSNYEQSYTLPDDVVKDQISAKVEDGILTVTMPKTEPKQKVTKAIEVS